MTVVFEDTFHTPIGNRYKTDAWRFSGFPHEETLPGNGEFQRYDSGQVKVSSSILQLSMRPMTGVERVNWVSRVLNPAKAVPPAFLRNLLSVSHVSGMVTTYPSLPFGPGTRFSARFRVPTGAGLWPAVWAFDYVNQTEIDLFEGNGRGVDDAAGNFSQGRHDHRAAAQFKGGCPKRQVAPGWHTAMADWSDPKRIVFTLDGQPNGVLECGPNMTKPMALIANLAVGSQNWSWVGMPTSETPADASFWLDWWKVERA